MTFDPRQSISTYGYGLQSLAILVHGPTKVGKTRLAGTTGVPAKTLILAGEPGLVSLREHKIRVYEIDTLAKLFGAITWLEGASRDGKLNGWWVFLDSISDIAERLLRHLKTTPNANGKLPDPRHAYGDVNDAMTDAIKRLRNLACNIVIIAEQERIEKPDGTTLYGPSMPGQKLSSKMGYKFDIELAMHAAKDADGRVYSWLQCQADGRFEAGDRTGALAPAEPPDLAALAAKIRATMPTTTPQEVEATPAETPAVETTTEKPESV